MECPRCLDNKVLGTGRKKMKIIDSREKALNVTSRRYECQVCGFRENTKEYMRRSLKEKNEA